MTRRLTVAAVALLLAAWLAAGGGARRFDDSTPPVVSATVSGTPGANGWYVSPVDVSWTVSDDESGIAARSEGCNAAQVPGDTTGVSITCSATNGDGLTTVETITIRIDTSPPAVAGSLDRPPDTPSGWYTQPVNVSFVGTDDVSGVVACDAPITYAGPDASQVAVTGSCTNGAGLVGSGGVTIRYDATPPVVVIESGPSDLHPNRGATFTFSSEPGAVFSCRLDEGAWEPCSSPVRYRDLVDGRHVLSVVAIDRAGHTSAPAQRSWTVDATPPAVAITAGPSERVTSTSATFAFASEPGATFRCRLDGGAFVPCTSPASFGSLAVGGHVFEVVALDAAGNQSQPASRAWTIDRATAVVALAVPPAKTVEANGPTGADVTFSVTATSNGQPLPPTAVSCVPPSGSLFALGTTVVSCTATDAVGNTATGSFSVSVVDTVPPVLTVPADLSLGTSGDGIAATDPILAAFLDGAIARDTVDRSPVVTVDAPAFFPVGTTTVTFRATDASGNTTTKSAIVRVATGGPTAPIGVTSVDRVPPGDVTSLAARAGDRVVSLTWGMPADADIDRVAITRTSPSEEEVVYTVRSGTTYRDTRVANGTEYRYLVVVFDRAGNRSAGVAAVATPKARLLLAPTDGRRVTSRPLLVWARVAGATYYNVQLYRGAKKVLSVWPSRTRFRIPSTWRFSGRRYRLTAGRYRWYVFPGFGARSAVRYGTVLGESSFVFAPRRK